MLILTRKNEHPNKAILILLMRSERKPEFYSAAVNAAVTFIHPLLACSLRAICE